jgi:SAM-dependent methyltransferase
MNQAELDEANAAFWSEVCGTHLANTLGMPSIEEFDRAYLELYPWLVKMIDGLATAGDRVLEVGPGYGTVGRMIRARGADYTAIDIAKGVISHTAEHTGGNAVLGSVLELDLHFEPESFDAVCAIGSLHHTGNLPLALEQVHRVLRPVGKALVMVYGDGIVHDANSRGELAPHTDIVPPEQVPALFAAFSAIQVDLLRPHNHTDIYVKAIK